MLSSYYLLYTCMLPSVPWYWKKGKLTVMCKCVGYLYIYTLSLSAGTAIFLSKVLAFYWDRGGFNYKQISSYKLHHSYNDTKNSGIHYLSQFPVFTKMVQCQSRVPRQAC